MNAVKGDDCTARSGTIFWISAVLVRTRSRWHITGAIYIYFKVRNKSQSQGPTGTSRQRRLCSLPRPHSCFSKAACCAESVVDTAGHPFPGPKRFCSVTSAVSTRASCDWAELSSGKDTFTDGLFTACPAITSATRC